MKRIDEIEPVHEFSDLRVIQRLQQRSDIQLGDMKLHKVTSIVLQARTGANRTTPRIENQEHALQR